MPIGFTPRDYGIVGSDVRLAEERGLLGASWYRCAIPRARLKELMQRRDGPAIRDTLLWVGLLILTGTLGYLTWGTWWAVLPFAVYGILYASFSDSRRHECGHGTAFKTTWMSDALYEVTSFMAMRESVPWRWSHTRHHTDTLIVGFDPEIDFPRPPPNFFRTVLELFRIESGSKDLYRMVVHCFGRITPPEAIYIPETERSKVYRNARIYASIYLVVIACAIASRSFLPLMYIGFPLFYGSWLGSIFSITQHAGLAEDVLDHRLNSRTVYMNFVFRFLYSEMNYHVEHHMFPLVPYHALGKLHQELKSDMPKPYDGLWEAYQEIIPTLLRQMKDPTYFVQRELPPRSPPQASSMAPSAYEQIVS